MAATFDTRRLEIRPDHFFGCNYLDIKEKEAALLNVAKAAVLPSVIAERVGSSLALQETLVSKRAKALSIPREDENPSSPNILEDARTREDRAAQDEEKKEDGEGEGDKEEQEGE